MAGRFKTKFKKKGKLKNPEKCGPVKGRNLRSAEERIIADAADPDTPEVAAFYESLLGLGRPVSQALSSDVPLAAACLNDLEPRLIRSFDNAGDEYGVQITRIEIAQLSRVRFNIANARKAASIYSKAGVDVVAGLRLCPAVDPESGGCMALDMVAIFGGDGARTNLDEAYWRSREGNRYRRTPIVWSGTEEPAPLKAALADLFRPPWSRLPDGDPLYDPDAVFSDEWDRGRRALLTLMCRSQLPLRNMLVGYEAGKAIAKGAIGAGEHLLKGRCRAAPEVVHRDEVAHRWFAELRRRGLDHISVPVMLLH